MTPDEQARAAFETLLGNIATKVRSVPESEREALLNDTQQTLRSMAMQQGLDEAQATAWAAEIDKEVRARLREPAEAGANDNAD